MTALDVLAYLEHRRIRLILTPEWTLRYRAPRGVMTRVLIGTIKSCQDPIITLLVTGNDAELPKGVSLPETDYRRFLTWRTGTVPASAQFMTEPLPAPQYHDVPTPAETMLGRACPKKVCRPDTTFRTGQPASTYYRRTGLCVACLARMKTQPSSQHKEDDDAPLLF